MRMRMKKPRRAAEQPRVKAPTSDVVLWRPSIVLASRIEAPARRKPVTLAASVVARKSAVRLAAFVEAHGRSRASVPAAIPIRLSATCNAVKAGSDIPRIKAILLPRSGP